MPSFRSAAFVCLVCACGHSNAAETTTVTTPPVASATATASGAPTASASSTPAASASAESSGMFCESGSPPMPVSEGDSRTGCWYQGTSCTGHGGQEGQQFKVAGTTVSAEFVHGGCNPGNYTLIYEPSTSPLKVRICAKRSPPQKCNAMIRDGASWDVAPLLKANHATAVTIVQP